MPALLQTANASIAVGSNMSVDVDVTGLEMLMVYTQIGNSTTQATAGSDNNSWVTVLLPTGSAGGVTTYAPGASGQAMPTYLQAGPGLSVGVAAVSRTFNVKGLEVVRVFLKNGNATTALPGQIDVFGA